LAGWPKKKSNGKKTEGMWIKVEMAFFISIFFRKKKQKVEVVRL
jgi:hypothetical protein